MAYSVADFAKKIRTKYPQYKGIGDLELTKSVVEKYPEYKDQVSIPGDGLMFSPEAVEGFNNSPIVKKVKGLFNQGSQIAKQTQQQIKAPAPTAEEAGIRRAPNQIKDSISSFFKGSKNRDVQIFGNLAGDVGSAAQMGLNFAGGGVFDTLTGLGNIRKQIESEGYMKTGKNIASGVGEMARQGFETGKQAIFGNEEESKAAQNKIVEFMQKYPDAIIFGGKGIMDLAKGAKNTAGFAKTMYDNPSFNVIDDAGNVAGKTTARQVVADNFRTAGKTLFGKKTPPQQPTAGPGGTQAQGRRWRLNEEPGQPTAGQGPIKPTMPDDGGAGTTFDTPNVATPFQDFDNTFRGGVTSTMNKIGGKIGKQVDKITTPVAEIITKNKTGSQKIYSAVAPRYNKLSGKNTQAIAKMKKQIETISAVAIQLNMRPKSLGDFIDSTDEIIRVMGEKVQEKLGKPLQVDMEYIASKIDEYVYEKSKAGIVTDAPGLNKLREQADAFRQMGVIDMPQANTIKQELNTRAGWDDPDLSQVTKNGYTTASVALGDALSTLLSDIPGEFRYYKETMGAGLAIMDDLMKSLTQEMKKSTNGIVESFSRISGLGDVLGGLISLSPSRTFSGLGTFIIGESHGKLKNKDFLIDRGFEQLYKELGKPEPTAPYIPKKSDFSGKGEAGITDQQIMKDFAGGKRYNEFTLGKQAEIDAKTKQETELKAQQEKMAKRAKEQEDAKKEKLETQKRRFEAALKSGLYEEIQPMKTPLREGDLTEFYGEVTRRFTDRGMQKVDTEDGTNMGVYEVGKVARPKGGESKAPANTPDEGAPEGEGGPIVDDATDGTVKTKGFKQDQYKKAADDMLGTSVDSLSSEGQALFKKAIQATGTKNRLALTDELLFNYGTTDAKTAYLMEIGERGNQTDIQDAINSLEKYGFGKENQYTPEEYEFTLSYMRDLLTTKDMEQPSLFSSVTDEPKTTGGTPQRQIQDTTEIRVNQTKPNSDITPSDGKNESGGNGSVPVGGGSSDGGGLVGTIKRQSNKSVIGRFTNSLLLVIESNGGMQDGYLKVESGSDAMMPFVVEEIGRNQIAVSHFYIQEGDVMYDPEVIFNVNPDGSLDAVSIMNTAMGGRALPIKNSDSFLDTRARNIEMYINAEYYKKPKVDQGNEKPLFAHAKDKPVVQKFTAKSKVGDSTQTATIQDGVITVTDRDGRKIVGTYTIPVKDREEAMNGLGNPESHMNRLVESKLPAPDINTIDPQDYSFYTRVKDGQRTAIKQAYKSYKDSMDTTPVNESKEYGVIGEKQINFVNNEKPVSKLSNREKDELGLKEITDMKGNKTGWYDIKREPNGEHKIISESGKMVIFDDGKNEITTNTKKIAYAIDNPIENKQIPIKETPLLSPENKSLSKQKKEDIQKTAVEILEKNNYSMDVADYTTEDIQTFKTYSGVSGLTAEAGILDQFYTPSIVIKSMWNLVGKYHEGPVQLALEPAAGIGRMALVGPEGIKYDMFEIDKTAGTIAQILNQDSKVTIGDFQDLFMDGRKPKNYQGKYYDIAISNPPYKARQTKQRGLGELQEMDRFEDYFTYRQLQMVKPGGVVVTIVPSAFLDKGSYKAKEMIASLGKLVDAYRLPEGTFPDTQIGTDILVFKKEPGNINDLIDKNFFKNNPDKILGEEKNATDRFGKPIIKVIGEKNAVTKIDGQTPKTIQKYSTTPTKPQTQQGLFAQATPNNAPIKKPDVNKPILAKKDEIFETQTITMGNQDPKILQYQKDVDVLGHLNGYTIDDIAKDPNGLNYMNGKIYSNYHYLQGNIREKLDDLERNYTGGKIDKNIYDRQKSKLEAILPKTISVMDVQFSPFDSKLINMPTGEQKKSTMRDSEKRQTVENRVDITVRDLFRDWLKDNKPRGITSSQYQISRILDGKVEKGDGPIKSKIQIDAQKAFNAFMKDGLPTRMQEDIAKEYNYTYNSYVKPDNKSQPLVISDVSTTFKGGKFKFTDAQVEGINHLTNKGAGLIAYGVGVGKTITGLGATIAAMQKGWTKRPLFVVPKATLQHTWIGTIKELFPNYKIVNLGGLGVPDIKRLTKEYGANPANWIKDGEIAITTFQGLKNITLKPENESLLLQDLQDVMGTPSTGNAKKDQKKVEKLEMEVGKSLKTFGKSEIFLEDLGIDHLTIDEVHNMKNIFQSAEVRKEDGEINPFGAVLKGTSSDLGRKAYLASQHIMRNNNNRGVYALSATPFNNQPIEVYNLLALMAKKRLESMGIKNINDFFTTFSYIQTEKVISPANFREIVERPVMKSFSNVGELQKLLTEFIDYKDSATAITMQQRPDKVVKRHIIKPSALQQTVNDRIRQRVDENQTKDGVYLVSMGQSIMNATSPYFVNSAYSHIPEPRNGAQIFRDSPKLQMALDMTKATLESGKGNVFWFMEQGVDYHPMIVDHIQETLGLKKGEVAFISGKITQDKKDAIAEGFRQGQVKVLVGGKTTSEGIDLQKHGVTTIFFSLNWNPTTTVQAGGRVWRPGNPRDKVYEAYLLSEDSGDLWLMQKYEEKASRINDIFSYQGRVFEDPSMTDGEAKMALLTDPFAKAEQQMNMDKIDIESKIDDYKYLIERNNGKFDILKNSTLKVEKLEESIKYYVDKEKYGKLPDYQIEQVDNFKKEIAREKRKVDDIIKKHDKDYSKLDREEAITNIMGDLTESNKNAMTETDILKKEAENIKEKLPEYEKYFVDEKMKIDSMKLTPEQQIEEYKKFLDSVKVI